MKNRQISNKSIAFKHFGCSLLILMLLPLQGVAKTNSWQPVASESLLKLPPNLIEKRIEQDFQMSPMAQSLLGIEEQLLVKGEQIQSLQSLINETDSDKNVEDRVGLVQLKSGYLDLMQESQTLRQQALDKRQTLYQELLAQMLYKTNQLDNQEMVKLKAKQDEARQRMEAVMQQVDQALLHNGYDKPSPYADEFAYNLSKIEQLKAAINKHKASLAPTINGIEVTADEYVRQLLMQVSSEQSLLDQESLMLSYMAKLVALDAQSLEYEIAYENTEDGDVNGISMTKVANSVDLFL